MDRLLMGCESNLILKGCPGHVPNPPCRQALAEPRKHRSIQHTNPNH
jgi:hypothetical protein